MTRSTLRTSAQMVGKAPALAAVHIKSRKPPAGTGIGDWVAGLALGPAGGRRYHLFKPPGVCATERLPLLVMLHGCGQDARGFALSTRMNRLAVRERFLVLYPEQDRRAHPHGCWNWYDTRSGHAQAEAATLSAAIDQVCLFYPVDSERIAIAGMSAGASMAALLATRYPLRFKAIVMHSGVGPGSAHSSMSALGAMTGRRDPAVPTNTAPLPPLLVIHGARDAVVSAANARAVVRVWAEAAGARPGQARSVQRGGRYLSTLTDYKLKGRTLASLCEIDTLGHAWSGGDPRHPHGDALGPDASRMVWAFALRQFRAAEDAPVAPALAPEMAQALRWRQRQ